MLGERAALYSRSCEEGEVHETGNADHLLFGQDGFHGLLHGVERLQRRNHTLKLFPVDIKHE